MRIINPAKKSEVIVRQLNKFNAKFESVTAKLTEEFKEQVPNTIDFSFGYCEGSQQAKVWLVTADDLVFHVYVLPKGWSNHTVV